MGVFDFFTPKPSVEKLTKNLINYVYSSIQTEKGVRVEDALCLIATIVAERCIKISNVFNIDEHDFEPGSAIFSERINQILVGSKAIENWSELPNECVFSRIKRKIDSHFDENSFPMLNEIFEAYATNVGKSDWKNLPLTIPENNKPYLLPLQVGYETREYVDKHINLENDEKTLRIVINTICRILIETKMAIDSSIALTLTFEMINSMSKTATMTDEKMMILQAESDKK